MCINESASWLSFTAGTITNLFFLIYLFKTYHHNLDNIYPIIFLIIYQIIVLIQIVEGLAWRQIKRNKKPNKIGKVIFLLNIIQPFLVFISLLILNYYNNNFKEKLFLISLIFFFCLIYINNIIKYLKYIDFDITPNKYKNEHYLQYRWWKYMNPFYYGIIILLSLLLLNNNYWKIVTIIFFIISISFTIFLYFIKKIITDRSWKSLNNYIKSIKKSNFELKSLVIGSKISSLWCIIYAILFPLSLLFLYIIKKKYF